MFNFKTICDDFESRDAALRCADAEALGRALERGLDDPAAYEDMARAARDWTARQAHVVDETAAALAPFLKSLTASSPSQIEEKSA